MSAHAMDGVDLAALDIRKGAEAGFWLQLLDPVTREPIPAYLKLLGADAEACHLKWRALRRARQLLLFGRGSEQEEFERLLDLLEAATVGWKGLRVDGQEHEFAADRVRGLYTRWRWMVDLADQAIGDRANFLPGSASS